MTDSDRDAPFDIDEVMVRLRAAVQPFAPAAMFGLAPKTFLKRLQKASEQSTLDLKSTAASPAAVAPQR